jgi:photosystem II stability/assembly factor-like uncharacterized protein
MTDVTVMSSTIQKIHIRPLLIASLICAGVGSAEGQKTKSRREWEPIGLTGNGGMFAPAISPINPDLMMLNCDMSASYRSQDGGRRWTMIDQAQLRTSTRCRPAFHPTDPKVIYASHDGVGLKVSRDGGEHWDLLAGTPTDLCGEIAIDPGTPDRMLIGNGRSVQISANAGRSWQACQGLRGSAVAFHFDQTTPGNRRTCFAATSQGIWRSDDGGSTWIQKTAGLPSTEIRSFCGGSRAKDRKIVLYCTVPSKLESGKLVGGVFCSLDRGESWQSAMGPGINLDSRAADEWAMGPIAQYLWVLTTDKDPDRVYAFNTNTGVYPPHHTAAFRSDDAGKSWRATFYPDPRFKECNTEPDFMTVLDGQFYQGPAFGVAVSASDPDRVIEVTDKAYVTRDGGKTWQCANAERASGRHPEPTWVCNGLVVTSTWNYHIDPFDAARHFIAYTDIGLARSADAGKTWMWWGPKGRAPWRNTCYELAFDPKVVGKVWGAFSDVHDIPNGNIIYGGHRADLKGGICVSKDHGASWQVANQGLPEAAAVSVVVDPKSPSDRRTLYASIFDHGVYKSTDDGKSWSIASNGLGTPANMRACRLQLHRDGTLFVLITGKRVNGAFLREGGGLYRSVDGGGHWKLITASRRLDWAKDFTVDPADSKAILVGAAEAQDGQAGLWRTTNGGSSWKRLAREGSEHFGGYLHPSHKDWIYMTLTEGAPRAGLWLSQDNGKTFKPMHMPFANAQRVTVDPKDPEVIYVTTFGGSVWKGPASEK